jgi:succinate-acetate transporter protein
MADQISSKLTHLPTYNTNIPEPPQQASAIRIIQPANGNPGPLGLFAFAVTTSTFISFYSSIVLS